MLYDEMQRTGGIGYTQGLHLDVCRGHTRNFIVPEQQSGFGSQPGFVTLTPEPGEMRRMAYSSVARGADGVLFFRWRPAHLGAEIYRMGIIDYDDIPRRRYDEAKQFAGEINAIKDKVLGTHVRMDVGIAGGDFDNQEAHNTYPMALPSPHDDAIILHRHCYGAGIACGFIHPEDDLSRLKVLYVPHWLMWKDEWTDRIEQFARDGGTVVLSARTGSRDENNHVIRAPAPGRSLAGLAGVTVEEFGRLAGVENDGLFDPTPYGDSRTRVRQLPESARRRYHIKLGNHEVVAGHMYELLAPQQGTEVLGAWSNRFADGQAAITVRNVGKGRVIYAGTYLTEALVPLLFGEIFAKADVKPLVEALTDGVEVTMRVDGDRRLLFVLNTADTPQRVFNLPPGNDLLGGQPVSEALDLAPFGCAILELGPEAR